MLVCLLVGAVACGLLAFGLGFGLCGFFCGVL